MEKKDLMQICRYYKGENECPKFNDNNKSMLWGYERTWVDDTLATEKRGRVSDYQNEMLDDYMSVGLTTFNNTDGISITLKALLFNRYCKTQYSMELAVEPFKKFYHKYYS